MEIIKIENLNFSYPKQNRKVLSNINIEINEGEFILVCGKSGCGKTTLLKHMKPEITPHGNSTGIIKYCGVDLKLHSEVTTASEIGYVMQDCNAQIVTDKVWHELAFGLENMGVDTETIRRKVAEMASFFGIQGWFRKNTNELSGGQKQLLNLASIMVMEPKIIILDEPTSQLDPIASRDFLDTITKINKELGTTIIMTEHELEEVFPVADRILVMDNSEVLCFGTCENVVRDLIEKKHSMFNSLPTPTKIYKEIQVGNKCPLTVKEGRAWIDSFINTNTFNELSATIDKSNSKNHENTVIELKDVWFKYDKNQEPVLRNVSLKVSKGEIYCILGGNGAGKTTTLSIMSYEKKPLKGKVLVNGIDIKKYKNGSLFKEKMAVLPQNPQSLFLFNTLREDLLDVYFNSNIDKKEALENVIAISKKFKIDDFLDQHPYDLSGGEMQKAAMAKIMLLKPKIILLDEPTKGLDIYAREELGKILLDLKKQGITIIMVTHDIEFSAIYSDRCALFFDGNVVSEGCPKTFFANNRFYTTAANRMARHININAVTCKDVIDICKSAIEVKE